MKFKEDICGYCGACISVCPTNALSLDEWQMNIANSCNECGNCVVICPLGAMQKS